MFCFCILYLVGHPRLHLGLHQQVVEEPDEGEVVLLGELVAVHADVLAHPADPDDPGRPDLPLGEGRAQFSLLSGKTS